MGAAPSRRDAPVYDRVSIFSAYPDLKEWIESNGQRKRGWYKNYDHSLVPRYW